MPDNASMISVSRLDLVAAHGETTAMTATADAVTVSISDVLRADRPPEQGDDDHHEQPEADQPQCAGDEPVEHGEGSPEGERADGDLRCERKSGRWRPCVRTVEGHAPMVEAGGSAGVRGHLSDEGSLT